MLNATRGFTRGRFSSYGYAVDIAISIRENLLNTLRNLMICALKLVKSWCETKGLKVNPLKSNVIIFTRKCKPEPVQPLKIGRREIAFTNSVKYLGIFLDPNLN